MSKANGDRERKRFDLAAALERIERTYGAGSVTANGRRPRSR
jgi:hypothetical protein